MTMKKIKSKKKPKTALNVNIIEHPVLSNKLTILRDKNLTPMIFRQIIEEISLLLAYEATRDLKTRTVEITTPLEKTQGEKIGEGLILVAVLRAGLGMLNGMMRVLPFATIGHIGIYRDRFVHATVEYYLRLPKVVKGQKIILMDPMLATGDTAIAAIERLKEFKVGPIKLISLIAAPQGVKKVNEAFPDVEIFTCSLERDLNSKGYIVPGVGDAGDRLYNTFDDH